MKMIVDSFKVLSRIFGFQLDDSRYLTEEKAMTYAPVWYGVNKISGHVGYLPLFCYRRLRDGGAKKADMHDAYSLLKRRPNMYQTAMQFKSQITSHAILWGNGRAAIVREGSTITELIPLMPDRTVTLLVRGEKYHVTQPVKDDRLPLFAEWYDKREKLIVLPDRDVLHIPGFSFDGVAGVSLVEMARRSLSLGMNAEATSEQQLSKGFAGTVMLEAPPGAFRKPEDALQFIEEFEERHTGPEAAGKPGLLREGIKANVLQMSNQDQQFLEQRKFQRQEAAMWLGLESILGDDSSVSYNSLEQKNLAYLSGCLMTWLTKWEQECDEKLLSESEKRRESHYFKFQTAALLRADFQTTITSLQTAIAARIINPNEARERLELNPYDGGDSYENPAITPGQTGTTQRDNDSVTVANRAIVSRLEHLLNIESKRVCDATSQENYCDWLDGFYVKWEATLGEAIANLGGCKSLAKDHCKASKDELLSIAGICTPETLGAEIKAATARWKERANDLAERLTHES